MKFRIEDLENYLIKKVDWVKIAEELTLKSFETTYENRVLEVDILPNRYPDASSLIGLAQEIAALKGKSLKIKNFKPKESAKKAVNIVKVVNQTKETLFYFGRVILNVKNQPSPLWLKNFVEFYGFKSINFLVDLANFVMIEYGAPLHIFDLDKIKDKTIIVRLSKKGEKFISLEGKEYILPEGSILITDKEKILGLAGIKGAKVCEVDFNTQNVFIEAAVFDPAKIRMTSQRLNLQTEASYRFERKVAPIRALLALERVSYLIQKNLGGEVLKGIIGETKLVPSKIRFDFEKVKKFTGLELKKKEIIKILKSLRIQVEKDNLIIPLDRLDLETEEDVIEEILRIYGLNKIKPRPEISLRPVFVEKEISFNQKIKEILTHAGYSEGYHYNFFGDKEKMIFKDFLEGKEIEILNPLSENYKYFQFSLIPNLLKSVYLNQFNFKEIRLFVIDKIGFWQDNKKTEKYYLGVVFASPENEKVFKEIKGLVNLIFKELRIEYEMREFENNIGLSVYLLKENEKIGYFGLVKKEVLEAFNLDLRVGFLEIDLEKLKDLEKLEKKFVFWGLYPEVIRDLSFFIDEKIKFSQFAKELQDLKLNFLKKIDLIDIYFHPQENKKSMTIRFVFQHQERSLTDEEVNQELEKAKKYLWDNYHVEFR